MRRRAEARTAREGGRASERERENSLRSPDLPASRLTGVVIWTIGHGNRSIGEFIALKNPGLRAYADYSRRKAAD
jgi:hypothetical protein